MDEIKNLIRQYGPKITKKPERFWIDGKELNEKIENALRTYAKGITAGEIAGLFDFSGTNNGTEGMLILPTSLLFHEGKQTCFVYYRDVERMDIDKPDSPLGLNTISFYCTTGEVLAISSSMFNKKELSLFVEEAKNIASDMSDEEKLIYAARIASPGSLAGGLSLARYQEVNKLFEEEKFHAAQGHGFAAERANHLVDRLTGHKAKILGDDFAKNGPDRMVDGILIQTKYYQTGQGCVNACFDEKGVFRYMVDGKPMQIEVPSDNYEAAVSAMEKKILEGKVPGVTDPNEAKNIIRKGHFTYAQAKNIAKAGTVESVAYDAVNGCIIAGTAFGLTTVLTLATNLWNGEDFETSLKAATYSGLKVGGTALITTVLASQLSKAGLNSLLVGSSEAIVAIMGPKASALLVNAFRHGTKIYGAAAMKSAAKLLRGNTITAGVTVVVLSSVDVVNIFRGRISGKQLFKNLTNTVSTVAGGTGGWVAGAAAGAALGSIVPGIGNAIGGVIGGIVGSVGGGALAGKASGALLDNFIEDDADAMVRILEKRFSDLAIDYLLTQEEAEKVADELSKILDGKMLKDMFASSNRSKFADNLLIPIIERIVKKRPFVAEPSAEQMVISLREVLEELADAEAAMA